MRRAAAQAAQQLWRAATAAEGAATAAAEVPTCLLLICLGVYGQGMQKAQ